MIELSNYDTIVQSTKPKASTPSEKADSCARQWQTKKGLIVDKTRKQTYMIQCNKYWDTVNVRIL